MCVQGQQHNPNDTSNPSWHWARVGYTLNKSPVHHLLSQKCVCLKETDKNDAANDAVNINYNTEYTFLYD